MKYTIKVKLIDTENGEVLFQDSIEYSEKLLEMALDFVVKLANYSNEVSRYEFEVIKEQEK